MAIYVTQHEKTGYIHILFNYVLLKIFCNCNWICQKGSYMRNYKYLEILLNAVYLENALSFFHTILHHSTFIQGHLVYRSMAC